MIQLGILKIEDFGCFKEVEINLNSQGLVLILGENNDTAAATSNGSGKSTIFKALSWGLYGQTVDGLKGDAVIRSGAKAAKVTQELITDDSTITVVRSKSRTSSESLGLYYTGGKSLGHRSLKEAQEALERIIGLDWLAFKNTVLYGQGDILHFADPRTTDSQRKAVLSKILRLERLEEARQIARRKSREANLELAKLDGEISILDGQLEAIDVSELKANAAEWDRARKEHIGRIDAAISELTKDTESSEKVQRKMDKMRKRAKAVAEILGDFRKTQHKRNELAKQRDDLARERSECVWRVKETKGEIDRIEGAIDEFDKGLCPTCGTPATSLHVKRKITAYRTAIGILNKRATGEEKELLNIDSKRSEVVDGIDLLDAELKGADGWREKAIAIDNAINDYSIQLARREEIEKRTADLQAEKERIISDSNPYRDQLSKARGRIADLKKHIADKDVIRATARAEVESNDFWVEGFGPAGLPSYLFDSVVPVVADKANSYLEVLSDGDLRIKMDTLTTLKGGAIRDKLSVVPTIEGVDGVAPSGGQLKKITLACDLALMDLLAGREGAAVDLLLLDEVLDGLDTAGRARVMMLLDVLRSRRSTIVVISHDPEIVEKFGKSVTVVKRGGIASIKDAT